MPMQLYSLQKVHVGKYPPVALLFSFSSLTGSFPSKGLFLSHNHNVPAHRGHLIAGVLSTILSGLYLSE